MSNKKFTNSYVTTAGSVKKKQRYTHRLNIVQPSIKSRSRTAMVNGSGQGASCRMFVCLFVLRFYWPVNSMGSCRA